MASDSIGFNVMPAQRPLRARHSGCGCRRNWSADLRRGPREADSPYEQAHPSFLVGEDMLNEGATFGALAVGPCGLAHSSAGPSASCRRRRFVP